MNPWLTCSNTFHPLAIGQIEDHMDGHVPNDGRTDGCWCEKMFYWPGGWPWWWKFPWVYWGPFMPADLPPKELSAEGAPAEGAPAEGAPAEGAPAEGPPAEGPPAEGPPVGGAAAGGAAAEGADRPDRPARPSSDHPPPPGEGAGRSGRSRLPERDAAAAVQQGPRVRVGRSSQGQEGRA